MRCHFVVLCAVLLAGFARAGMVVPLAPAELARWQSSPRPSLRTAQLVSDALPKTFDWRAQWPHCVTPVLDQGQCGSCWAFAATESLSDRFCIATGKPTVLSPMYALECEFGHLGCWSGSMSQFAWHFLVHKGCSLLSCTAYHADNYTKDGCETRCDDGSALKLYYAANYSHVGSVLFPSRHVQTIMEALLEGPLDASFMVYEDFYNYAAGQVYEHKTGKFVGGHSVKLVGWGTQNTTDYWLVQNSWGGSWGDAGFFMIKRGVDECFFESQIYAGWPRLN